MRRTWRWVLRIAGALALVAALRLLPMRVFGGGGLGRVRLLERDLGTLQSQVTATAADNERLRRQARALRDDWRAIERVARDELGWVRPGEVVFQFQ